MGENLKCGQSRRSFIPRQWISDLPMLQGWWALSIQELNQSPYIVCRVDLVIGIVHCNDSSFSFPLIGTGNLSLSVGLRKAGYVLKQTEKLKADSL